MIGKQDRNFTNGHLSDAVEGLKEYLGTLSSAFENLHTQRASLLEQNNQLFSDIQELEERLTQYEALSILKDNEQVQNEEHQTKIDNLENTIGDYKSQINSLTEQIESLGNQLSESKNKIAEFKGIEKDLEFARKEIARRNITGSQKEELSKGLRDKLAESEADIYKLKDENNKLRAELRSKEQGYEELTSTVSHLEEQKAKTELELIELKDELIETESVMQAKESTIGNFRELIDSVEMQHTLTKAELSEASQSLKKLRQTCRSATHENTELKEEAKYLNTVVENLKEESNSLKSEIQLSAESETQFNLQKSELEQIITNQKNIIASAQESDKSLSGSLVDKDDEIIHLSEKLSKLQKDQEEELKESEEILLELDKKNIELLQTNTELLTDLALTKQAESINEKLQSELESARNANSTLRQKIETMTHELNEANDSVLKMVTEEQYSNLQAQLEQLENLVKVRYNQISILENELNLKDAKLIKKDESIQLAVNKIDNTIKKLDDLLV